MLKATQLPCEGGRLSSREKKAGPLGLEEEAEACIYVVDYICQFSWALILGPSLKVMYVRIRPDSLDHLLSPCNLSSLTLCPTHYDGLNVQTFPPCA
jgi:hypothetical protein